MSHSQPSSGWQPRDGVSTPSLNDVQPRPGLADRVRDSATRVGVFTGFLSAGIVAVATLVSHGELEKLTSLQEAASSPTEEWYLKGRIDQVDSSLRITTEVGLTGALLGLGITFGSLLSGSRTRRLKSDSLLPPTSPATIPGADSGEPGQSAPKMAQRNDERGL